MALKGYLLSQRWNILLMTQAIFTCGIVYNRYVENQAAASATAQKQLPPQRPLPDSADK
ncbi:hypothetical protein PF005_g14978 [Phytophthora fragariae]|uniref:Uncharacterized protein n=1 Tax=Phytophthora fragariae TaxID=53985 RepID=A0A6A3RRD6_9STRA|nr:hypothetical protein PF003_g2668 [Phytophthora fragariae]KAE8933652.1 hypothetical protein PF009_g16347 [Phytophthora fragariae]KAE9001161.1 hypothetical protein PF011_g13868 [Phytophthora fragariae]KAE9101084.1 hypothetical protein PF007_g15282 [Phytophthora fragariae]KAE9101097.1 hypothetical protein PF010_g14562 [Phytophthora fragariae]